LAAMPALGTEISEDSWAFHDEQFVRLADAKVSIATHALNYGTGIFEGIRAYWDDEREQLSVFRLRDHFARMERSCRIMRTPLPMGPDALAALTVELLRRNAYRQDVYVRPLAYKAARSIKVALDGLRPAFSMFSFPLGAYLPTNGLSATVTSWRRVSDNAIPARGKLTGAYINTALAVDEAHDKNADEAIFLTESGHVSEGGSSNIFIVRDGVLATPPVSADILEGITRDSVMRIARERLGLRTVERDIDRTELYLADEVFFCGTGAQVAPCVTIDRRPVGDGRIGPVTKRIGDLYFAVARGADASYPEWRTAVYA
ncbi:MAG TPA: branched-chain amino acid transaminase, partial [Candidatus Acidoferrales bacterium]|nr:branched-chain amino acid transaminase [Candidatus Acidoferrales bacterium]